MSGRDGEPPGVALARLSLALAVALVRAELAAPVGTLRADLDAMRHAAARLVGELHARPARAGAASWWDAAAAELYRAAVVEQLGELAHARRPSA